MSVVDEIKARLDPVEIIGQTVHLKKAGRIYKGLCPFHGEKTPSFVVYSEQGTWHCFGACGTGGDLFTFVMKRDNLDFGDALRLLAERAGVELHPQRAGDERTRRTLLEIHQAAGSFYHYLLKNHAAAGYAREYLDRRRIERDSIEVFELGFSPNTETALRDHLESKSFRIEDIQQAGLVVSVEGGGLRDRFRGRLMFPIRNRRGEIIGFGARALDDEQQPKYLNSPDTPLFSKSDVLYGLDRAKDAIVSENLAVIVEGYTDVIVAHQEGFRNVVAALGTALTEKQLAQLRRLTPRYALALDADTAGEHATERGLELARQALGRKNQPVPVGPGLVGFEERLQAELLIVELPAGKDPDQVILEDRQLWKDMVEKPVPLVDYYFRVRTRDLDLRSAHGKSEAVRRLIPILAEIEDPVQREHYTQELGRLAQVDSRALAQQLVPRAGVKVRRPESKPAEVPAQNQAKFDEHLLGLVLSHPDLLGHVRFLSPDDLNDGAAREIWSALSRYSATPDEFDLELFLDSLSGVTRAEADRLRAQVESDASSEFDAARELEAAAYRVRLQHDREELLQLQYVLVDSSPDEEQVLFERADLLRTRLAEAQRALQARSVLKNPSPSWTLRYTRGNDG